MTETSSLTQLREAAADFLACLRAQAAEEFLHRYTLWSPRDVAAHLAGWNGYTLTGILEIQRGNPPTYLEDIPNDFANLNAASVERFDMVTQDTMAQVLTKSLDTLISTLAGLDEEAGTHDFGARNALGQPVIIQRQVDALTADYLGHAEEIMSRGAQP